MRHRLHHPLWAHLPAVTLIGVMIGAMINAMPLPARVPVHFGLSGQPDRWGSPWEMVPIIAISVVLIGISALGDELWARQEVDRKRFNWLSLFDEIFVGFITGTLLSMLAVMHDPNPVFTLDWGMIALIVGGAVVAAIMLETLRKWNPVQESAIPEDTASIEREIGGLTEEGKPWDYQDTQNPAYMNWVVIGTGLVGILAAVSIWPQSPWLSVLIFVLAALPVVFYGGLRTSVTPERVRVRLGFLGIPLLTLKIIDLADVQMHQFSPLADFGGYGIRFNAQMKAYFLRGNQGVKLTTVRGKNYLIGSDHPERLSAVIQIAKRLAG